jgi:hypothetical protein
MHGSIRITPGCSGYRSRATAIINEPYSSRLAAWLHSGFAWQPGYLQSQVSLVSPNSPVITDEYIAEILGLLLINDISLSILRACSSGWIAL